MSLISCLEFGFNHDMQFFIFVTMIWEMFSHFYQFAGFSSCPMMSCWRFSPRPRTHCEYSRTWRSALRALLSWPSPQTPSSLAWSRPKRKWCNSPKPSLQKRRGDWWRNGCFRWEVFVDKAIIRKLWEEYTIYRKQIFLILFLPFHSSFREGF